MIHFAITTKFSEAATRGDLYEKVFLEISQNFSFRLLSCSSKVFHLPRNWTQSSLDPFQLQSSKNSLSCFLRKGTLKGFVWLENPFTNVVFTYSIVGVMFLIDIITSDSCWIQYIFCMTIIRGGSRIFGSGAKYWRPPWLTKENLFLVNLLKHSKITLICGKLVDDIIEILS